MGPDLTTKCKVRLAPKNLKVKEPVMDIMEIVDIQKRCRKQARAMTRKAYSRYDAIWTDGIKITPELAAMGENVIAAINRKMPNMLMRNHERPEIGEIASRHGFDNSAALVEYLLNYEPRGHHEENIYQALLQGRLLGCSEREIEIASTMATAEIMAVIRNCNKLAREMTDTAYEKYDEIWSGKILITPELLKHGREVINEINRKMPNLLTHNPMCSAIDQVAMEYKFDSVQELVDWLLDYKPRTSFLSRVCDELVCEALGLDVGKQDFGQYEIDEVPF